MSRPKSDEKTGVSLVNIDVELTAIQTTIMDLTYDGFNAAAVRESLKRKLDTQERCTLVAAYCQVGNNVNRAIGKVKKQRNDVALLLRRSETTLARVGLSHAALVRAIRASQQLPKRIANCSTPSDFQDPATAPYHETGRDFHDKFSKLIYNSRKAKDHVDYFGIAVSNLDEASVALMKTDIAGVITAMKTGTY